nr:retrovirus-related Pol polyprotein from transposon TNT 1-94 [Tanacetum cinerariifolium]
MLDLVSGGNHHEKGIAATFAKLLRAKPTCTSKDTIPVTDLTKTSTVSDRTKQVIEKDSLNKSVKKKTQTKSSLVLEKKHEKKVETTIKELLLTLICPMFIDNYIDHLGNFDEKVDDGFFLGYSLVSKAFRIFNIIRQELEETFHVTLNEGDEVINHSSKKANDIKFNENISFFDGEFSVLRNPTNQYQGYKDSILYVLAFDPLSRNNIDIIPDLITPKTKTIIPTSESPNSLVANNHLITTQLVEIKLADDDVPDQDISKNEIIYKNEVIQDPIPPPENNLVTPAPQDKWFGEQHILLVSILGEPIASVTTRSRVRESKTASTHECMYAAFLLYIKTKKVIDALKEEGWVLATQEELNQFKKKTGSCSLW